MLASVVPYIGTWIETETWSRTANLDRVVPYIGTWIETIKSLCVPFGGTSYLI